MTAEPETIDTLARTVWGEARGCGEVGMRHVAEVIVNRAARPSWWGHDIESVCLAPWQFSCRNPNDPNRKKLLSVTAADPAFAIALNVAERALRGELQDETKGADSYYATSMKAPPVWAATAEKTLDDGWHAFYRTAGATTHGSAVSNVSTHSVAEDA